MLPNEFRVWDSEKKELTYSERTWFLAGSGNVYEECSKGMFMHDILDYKEPGTCIVTFFTGLKDKKGAKLFERDIVKYGKSIHELRYFPEYGAFGLYDRTFNRPVGRGGSSTRYEPYFMTSYHLRKMEKLGNIFENAEILLQT